MHSRFTSNLALAVVGGFLVPASLAFGTTNVGWIALGAGAAAFLVAAVAFPVIDRAASQRWLDVLVALVGVVTIVESRVFDDAVLRWTSFGLGAALSAIAGLGLVLHERDRERRLAALTGAGSADGRTAVVSAAPHSVRDSSEAAA